MCRCAGPIKFWPAQHGNPLPGQRVKRGSTTIMQCVKGLADPGRTIIGWMIAASVESDDVIMAFVEHMIEPQRPCLGAARRPQPAQARVFTYNLRRINQFER